MRTIHILSFITIFLTSLAQAGWQTTELFNNSGSVTYQYGVFIDPTTQIRHALFYSYGADTVMYRRVSAAGVVMGESNFTAKSMSRLTLGAIRSGDNGGYVNAIMIGNTEKRREIWYTESKNKGQSWTEPAVIPRGDQSEYSRDAAALVTTMGRTFVFYAVNAEESGEACRPRYLRMVTKSSSSSAFSKETAVFAKSPIDICKDYLVADYTIKTGRPILHVIWGSSYGITYTKSENFGISWAAAKIISTDFGNLQLPELTANRKVSESTLAMTFSIGPSVPVKRLLILRNHGDQVDTMDIIGPEPEDKHNYLHQSGIAICGTSSKPMLYSLMDMYNQPPKYSVIDLSTMSEKRLSPRPFESHGTDVFGFTLACSQEGGKTTVAAITEVGNKQPVRRLLMDTIVYTDN